jgi:hypothetical protein
VHSALRRFAALFVLAAPIALSGATSGAASTRVQRHREARALTLPPLATTPVEEERAESAVVLVVLDGLRWQEVFGGVDPALARQHAVTSVWTNPVDLMPNLHRLIDSEGVAIGAPGHGSEITASGPQFISMPGYIEIFAGRPDLGCFRNDCTPTPMRTIADQVRDAGETDDVALVSSWPNIARAASTEPGFVLTRRLRACSTRALGLRRTPGRETTGPTPSPVASRSGAFWFRSPVFCSSASETPTNTRTGATTPGICGPSTSQTRSSVI